MSKDYEKAIEEAANTLKWSGVPKLDSDGYSSGQAELRLGPQRDAWEKGFITGAKSEAAKEFHQQGMYTQEQMLLFCDYILSLGTIWIAHKKEAANELFIDWIEQQKKKP